jgi:2-polyprenyl-3-methyl-5-hydroxy-6-metoxy-1,4-benzoquinol methylase
MARPDRTPWEPEARGRPGGLDGDARCLHDENAYGHRKRLGWILARVRRRDRIIEFGCGTGVMIALPLARLGHAVLGVDTDRASIEAGRALFAKHGLSGGRLDVVDLSAVPWRPDVVIASEVLEHLPDRELEAVLRAIRGKLGPGGRLLVTVPNGYGWFEFEHFLWFRSGLGRLLERLGVDRRIRSLKSKLCGWVPGDEFPASLSTSPHVQRFTHRSIRRRLAEAGFEVTAITGSVLFAGPFSNLLFTGVRPVMRLNCALGTWLPRIAAGFYVACRVGGVESTGPAGRRP